MIIALEIAALLLVLLVVTTSLAHALELPGKLRLSKEAYIATVPAARWGTPDDIAHAVAFFAAPASSFVTGQRLLVDGGRHLLP